MSVMDFRLFYVNGDDALQGYEEFSCSSNEEALNRARALLQPHPDAIAIEVWRRSQMVGRVKRELH